MCYLIAKDRESHGCYALKTEHGKSIVELKRKLNKANKEEIYHYGA